jgi:osmotically-inducible protein OsmY
VRVIVRQLDADPIVARERIRVVCDEGVITLEGVVSAPLARQRAVAVLQVVRGVRAVVDRLAVASLRTSDGLLSLAAAAALARDPAVTTQRQIAARARDGVVRLSGVVEADATRRIVEDDLSALPGVSRVVNDLAVVPHSRGDRALAWQVERIVSDDPWVDGSDVHVAAEHGTIKLSGSVHSAAERARAESDARAASPLAVDPSGLRIADAPDDGTLRAAPPATRPDGDIRQALADAVTRDPRVRPFAPGIDVRNGVVVLTGVAPSRDAALAIADDAANVPGIASVRDALTITPPGFADSDAAVQGTILDAIRRDPSLGTAGLWVEVISGRVILRGVVPTDTARINAMALASSIAGVTDVEDALLVQPPRLGMADADLGRSVNERLTRSGWVSPSGVRVHVTEGVVALDGSVDTLNERQAATEIAYEAGARRVLNRLTVTGSSLSSSRP